jgi:hypothetical protein
MVSVNILSVTNKTIMLSDIMLNVVMLHVVALQKYKTGLKSILRKNIVSFLC